MALKITLATVLLSSSLLSSAGLATAASSPSIVGHWRLNRAKSSFTSGSPLNALDIIVSPRGEQRYNYRFEWIDGTGTSGAMEFLIVLNGPPTAISGYAGLDAATLTRLGPRQVKLVYRNKGKPVEERIQRIAADGKTAREDIKIFDDAGHSFDDLEIFDHL